MAYVIEQSLCSACHRCRTECPKAAIRFKNAKYWIDPEKCVSCGRCARVCHNGCISNPEKPAPKAAPHEKLVKTCDVCVIGGGGSGLVAANRAQDSGCKVLLLEKMHEVGGSSWYAMTQWCAASYNPPHLAAISPWEGEGDLYRDEYMRGGIPMSAMPATGRTFGFGSIEDIAKMMNDAQEELDRLVTFHDTLMKQLREIKADEKYTDNDVRDFTEAANQMLKGQGLKELATPNLTYRQFMLQRRRERLEAQQTDSERK